MQSSLYFFVTKHILYIFFSLQCERFEEEGCKVDNTERCERLEKLCGCVADVITINFFKFQGSFFQRLLYGSFSEKLYSLWFLIGTFQLDIEVRY